MKALAFCVSREHARFMVEKFRFKGISCDLLTSDNSEQRAVQQQRLKSGDIQVLFVVDIFNEGVDIPELDTLLFLRPTESLTVFLQQLGRGLRLIDGKECCTVLDFVGNARPEYDFSQKFRALVGKTNQGIDKEIKQDFPHLPLGCRIDLQEKTQAMILKNIAKATLNKSNLLSKINNFNQHTHLSLTLTNFLDIYPNITLEDIYKIKSTHYANIGGWSVMVASSKPGEAQRKLYQAYYRAINNRLLNCTSISYLTFLLKLSKNNFVLEFNTNQVVQQHEQTFALMCHYDFWDDSGVKLGFKSLKDSLSALCHSELQVELNEVLALLIKRLNVDEFDMPKGHNQIIDNSPLKMHVRHPKEHIMVAFGDSRFDKKSSSREGVLNLPDINTELLFVTLNKSDKQFSPTTMYHDYAISPVLFHWQTQNSAKPTSGKGLAYIKQKETKKSFILFVREQSKDENGRTMGFVNFGPVEFIKSEGSQPMNITWKLACPMPAYLWHDTAKLAVG